MTHKQFRELCEAVLIPLFSDLLHERIKQLDDVLDIHANELMRIGDRLAGIETSLDIEDDAE
jgi:hypothetical protein